MAAPWQKTSTVVYSEWQTKITFDLKSCIQDILGRTMKILNKLEIYLKK